MISKTLTVGILSPGEMGSAIASEMVRSGIRVISALDDRSDRTKLLANNVNIEDIVLIINFILDTNLPSDKQEIINETTKYLEPGLIIKFELVKKIPKKYSEKIQHFFSQIN